MEHLRAGTARVEVSPFDVSDRDELIASLALLRDLAPDLMVSSACPTGVGAHAVAPRQWPGMADQAVARLRT